MKKNIAKALVLVILIVALVLGILGLFALPPVLRIVFVVGWLASFIWALDYLSK